MKSLKFAALPLTLCLAFTSQAATDTSAPNVTYEKMYGDVAIKYRESCKLEAVNPSDETLKVQVRCDNVSRIHTFDIDTTGRGIYFEPSTFESPESPNVAINVYLGGGIDAKRLHAQFNKPTTDE